MPDRRAFLLSVGAAAASPWLCGPGAAHAIRRNAARVLILVELQGGNDALNTLIPYADAAYYALRPGLAVPRAAVLPLDGVAGLHPALRPLMPLWDAGEFAIVSGVGHPGASLSHARAIAAWDAGASGDEGRGEGWLARALNGAAVPVHGLALDGVAGPLAGCRGAVAPSACSATGVPPDIAFLQAMRDVACIVAMPGGHSVIKISLRGFDTHAAQATPHARLLEAFARGVAALAVELKLRGRWDSALVMTYSEFGRRAAENDHGGTDHGTGGVQLALGGAVRGGLYGASPPLDRLDAAGGIPCQTDFRRVYAAVLEQWWGLASVPVLGARYEALPLLRA